MRYDIAFIGMFIGYLYYFTVHMVIFVLIFFQELHLTLGLRTVRELDLVLPEFDRAQDVSTFSTF